MPAAQKWSLGIANFDFFPSATDFDGSVCLYFLESKSKMLSEHELKPGALFTIGVKSWKKI